MRMSAPLAVLLPAALVAACAQGEAPEVVYNDPKAPGTTWVWSVAPDDPRHWSERRPE